INWGDLTQVLRWLTFSQGNRQTQGRALTWDSIAIAVAAPRSCGAQIPFFKTIEAPRRPRLVEAATAVAAPSVSPASSRGGSGPCPAGMGGDSWWEGWDSSEAFAPRALASVGRGSRRDAASWRIASC